MAVLATDPVRYETAAAAPSRRALAHIPGEAGWPVIGSTLDVLADPKGYFERLAARHGRVVRSDILGETRVSLLGPEANELVLLDPQRLFSARLGWETLMGRVFPGNLLMMDLGEHRLHRRALSVAFKAGPMKAYLSALDAAIAARVADWRSAPGPIRFYPAMKRLTLDLAASAFLGAEIGPETEAVNRALVDMVAAIAAPVRWPLPGTQMRRGVRGRAVMVSYLSHQIPVRRERGGNDLFSQLCRATTEDGAPLSAEAVTDLMSGLLMAAHDTLTSSLTAFVWFLAADPAWQERLREEVRGLGLRDGEPLRVEHLEAMRLTEMAFKETLRLVPPGPALSRKATRDFEFMGHRVPAGTSVLINPLFTHHMAEVWPDPDRFDPTRFGDEAQAGRHRFAFVPFGGGAHMCLGLNYAYMQAKCFARHLLSNLSVGVEPGYAPAWQMWPIPKPRDGLRVALSRVA